MRLRKASLFLFSLLPFAACLPNHKIWDDFGLFNTRLAGIEHPFHLWRENYLGGDAYRPFGLPFLYIESRFSGGSTVAMHIVSLLLHGCCVLALHHLLGKITTERIAWLTALLFAVHPIHAEAVAMLYGQLELLTALFSLLALSAYVESVREESSRQLALALAFAFLAACSKESGMMLPVLVVLLRVCWLRVPRWVTWREALFGIPVVAYVVIRIVNLGQFYNPPTPPITEGMPFVVHANTVITSLGTLLRLTSFPTGQTLYYGHLRDDMFGRPVTELAWIFSALVLVILLVRSLGWRPVLFGAGWFLALVFPVLNILPALVVVGERNLYLALAGAALLGSAVVCETWKSGRGLQAGVFVLVMICVVDGNLVVRQWHDPETFWRSSLASHPASPMAHVWLARELLLTPGHEAEAVSHFRVALELNLQSEDARQGLEQLAVPVPPRQSPVFP